MEGRRSPLSVGIGKRSRQDAVGTPAVCAVVIGVETEEDEVRRGVHGVESDLRGRGDRGEAPDRRERLKGGRSVMTPEEEGEAVCNGFKSEGALCNGFGEESIAALWDGFEVERDEKPCVTVSSGIEFCVTTRSEYDQKLCRTGLTTKQPSASEVNDRKPCVTVSSKSEPCVTARVESVLRPYVTVSSEGEPCVTARGDDDQKLCTTGSTNKRPCVTEVKDRKSCVTVSRESELCVTARVEEDGDSTPKPKRKLWISWQPSSSEDGSESESESEEE